MFQSCSSLQSVPLFNTAVVTTMSNMFNGCASLQTVPLFNTAAVTIMSNMFTICQILQTVPLFNTAAVTNMSSMFQNCGSLQTVPLFNTAAVTTMGSMFNGCATIQTVPLFNTAAVTNMSFMFNGARALQTVPLFNTAAVTNMGSMFQSCTSLQSVPLFNTATVTTISSMFNGCSSFQRVPLFNMVVASSISSMFSGCSALTEGRLNGTRYAISYSNCKLSKTALESIFTGLGKAEGAQTFTIGTNWGAPAVISLAGTTTADSVTVTMASTAGIVTGMQVTGTNAPLTTAGAVTLQDVGDTVTRTAHGLVNNDEVSFATIVTTIGIETFTTYFVVGAAANTFQVSLTLGGAAIALITDGSGSILYRATVTAINANVSVTLSRPATASGATTLAYRLLTTGTALLKGWTVSG